MKNDQEKNIPDIENLTQQFQKLRDRKIESMSNLKNAQQILDDLKEEALKEYGTDELEGLKEKLRQIKEENAKKRAEYHETLQKIESELIKIESAHQATDAS